MKKRYIAIGAAAALLAALAGGFWFYKTNLAVDGRFIPRDTRTLDLSGTQWSDWTTLAALQELESLDVRDTGLTVEEYEQLRALLPECEIQWQVPFQGSFYETDTKELTITAITAAEMDLLQYFPQLETINALGCADLDSLLVLRERFPDCEVRYEVPVGGWNVAADTAALDIADADAQELMTQLRYLPGLKTVTLSGQLPEADAVYALMLAYPYVEFVWPFTLCGVEVCSSDAEIDLSGVAMESVEEVENSLKYFNHLEKVIMCDCGISSEEMDALWKRNPETRFVWNVTIKNFQVRTDITAFIPYKYGIDGHAEELHDWECTEFKYLVDMVCIDLGHMKVRDLSFVQYMPNLEYFLICDNGVQDISPLAGLQKLKYVELFNNNITDISALAECPALEDVNITYCKITDITPLLELPNLKNLWLDKRYLTDEQIAQVEEAHPDARIVLDAYRSTGRGWRELPNYYAQRDLLGMWYMVTVD